MNILLVTDFYPPATGGIASYVKDLALGLCRKGHRVHVYATVGPREKVEHRGLTVETAIHTARYLPFLYKQKGEMVVPPIPDPTFIQGVNKVIDRCKPEIIHAHGQVMFPLSFVKQRHLKIPMIANLHDFGFICPKRDLVYTYNNEVCELINAGSRCLHCARRDLGILKSAALVIVFKFFDMHLNRYDRLIAPTHCVVEKAQAKYPARIDLIPDFVGKNILSNDHAENDVSEEDIDIVFGGALTPQKGIHEFLEACDILRKDFPRLKAVVVGFTRAQYDVTASAKSTLVMKNMPRSKALNIYKRAKIVVIPSICMEAGPNIMALEAMALSKPVVASNLGGLKETVINRETGFLVPPKDPHAIAEAVRFLLQDGQLLRKMGRVGLSRFLEIYEEDKILEKIERTYEDTIAEMPA